MTGLDFDLNKNDVYWTDTATKKIQRAPVNGGSITDVVTNSLGTPEGLAVDWQKRQLYWTDTGKNTIETSDLNGNGRKTLINVGLDQPRAICLDPTNGWVYWSDWGSVPKIEKAKMSDGSGRVVIVRSGIRWPNALALDYDENHIYWADAYYRKIERADLSGANRKLILLGQPVYSPYHMTLYKKRIYWTDWNLHNINHADKDTGLDRVWITGGMSRPTGIHIVHPDRQPNIGMAWK